MGKKRDFREVIRCDSIEKYRYVLEIKIDHNSGPRLVVIQKNPSTADEKRSDATVGKVEAWARRNKFSSVLYLNLFAYRSTQPELLNEYDYSEIVGDKNNQYLREIVITDTIVAAWGNPNRIKEENYHQRIKEVLEILKGRSVKVVGDLTKDGYPRHGKNWNYEPPLHNWID